MPVDQGAIAVIGMSALFAKADGLQSYWQNICDRVDGVTAASRDWLRQSYDPSSTANDRLCTEKGGFLHNLARFNPVNYGIMPRAVDGGGPDQYLAIVLVAQALADACYGSSLPLRPFNGVRTGLILGYGSYMNRGFANLLQHGLVVDQTMDLLQQLAPQVDAATLERVRQGLKDSLPPFTAEMCPGLVPNNVTGRVANRLDLMGPNYVVDAACASSLISLHLGMEELRHGRCDIAIVGGVNASTPAPISLIFNQLGALTRNDIRPFDEAASGTLLGEGLGILVLKRLSDAEADQDRIYATLRGVGSASDGKALSSVAPRLEGEALAMRRAYDATGIDPRTIGLVEAHGTSIPLGDRTEIASLRSVFGDRGVWPHCALGSVKSMVAHCTTAAGAAGLIKTILALYYKVLPPTICDRVNPNLEIEATPFYINNRLRPWIHGSRELPRRAAVNAFGFGGINAHAILEEYRGNPDEAPLQLHSRWPTELVLLAAETQARLQERVVALHADLEVALEGSCPPELADIAHTLSRQQAAACRLAIVATSPRDLLEKLSSAASKLDQPQHQFKTRSGLYYGAAKNPSGKTVFLFPGEGAQYADMLADLCIHFPEVRRWFDLLDEALASPGRPSPSSAIFPAPTSLTEEEHLAASERLTGMEVGPAAVFVASMAMHELMQSFGLKADAMVGHSSGENSALTASGMVNYDQRSQLIEKMGEFDRIIREVEAAGLVREGTLLAVGGIALESIREAIRPYGDGVVIAMDNCSHQAIVFGMPDEMQTLADSFRQMGGMYLQLPFNRAYHTSHFAEVALALRQFYDSFDFQVADTPVYSCASCERFPEEPSAMRDLAAHQWMAPVRFREMVQKLHDDGFRQFIEIGPSANLTAFVVDILRGRKDSLAVASNHRNKAGLEQLQHTLAQLFVHGVELDVAPLFQRRPLRLVDFQSPPSPREAQLPFPTELPVASLPEDVAELFRQSLDLTASASSPPVSEPHREMVESGMLNPDDWPLLGRIVSRSEDRLVCERRFSLRDDLFLEDHVFGGALSLHPTDLKPLPVIPLTFSLEMMAEAASLLAGPELQVVSLHGLRGYRWLALDSGAIQLRIEAHHTGHEGWATLIEVRILQVEENAEPVVVFEGEVRLQAATPPAPPAAAFVLADPRRSALADEDLYRTCMFHGPRLQGVTHLQQWSADRIAADLRVLPVNEFFKATTKPRFILDAGLIDAAGQLVGYWISEQWGPADSYCFPFQISVVDVYAPPLPAGSDVRCRCWLTFTAEHQIAAQFELLDASGSVVYRIVDWTDICYQVPRNNFYPCRLNPSTEYLSEPWLQAETGTFCRQVSPFPDQFLDKSWGIWKRMLAHLMLTQAERDEWYILPEAGVRRTEWLLGRISAKDAVRQWAWQIHGVSLAPVDVQIAASPSGQPYVVCSLLSGVPLPAVSISHSEGHAFGAVVPTGQAIGIDVELRSSSPSPAALEDAFSANEHPLLQPLDAETRALVVLGLWSAKEAASKALGTGLQGAPRSWELSRYSSDFSHCWLTHEGQSYDVRILYTDLEVVAICVI
jgi:acyl transferase domain-containing protein/phosphopantetheinyl transferase